VALQERLGLQGVADGEFRRTFFDIDFPGQSRAGHRSRFETLIPDIVGLNARTPFRITL
jgi:hypothetical protein